jgi:hypothetical protein
VTGEDDPAGDNDDFLQAQRRHQQIQPRHQPPASARPLDGPACPSVRAPSGALFAESEGAAYSGHSLLYVLMSLQC